MAFCSIELTDDDAMDNLENEFETSLINLIKRHPNIYSINDPQYGNRLETEYSWQNISSILKKPIIYCTNKWLCLVQTFFYFNRMESTNKNRLSALHWEHYKLFKEMQPLMVERYVDLVDLEMNRKTYKQTRPLQVETLISKMEMHMGELVGDCSIKRRQAIWSEIAAEVNVCISVIKWQKLWWDLKQRARARKLCELKGITISGSENILCQDKRILKICGISPTEKNGELIKSKMLSYIEIDNDTVPCEQCNTLKTASLQIACEKCSDSGVQMCDVCSLAPSSSHWITSDWSLTAKRMLPLACHTKSEIRICHPCNEKLMRKASEIWKVCRICMQGNQQLEHLKNRSLSHAREVLYSATSIKLLPFDGFPCYVCHKCKDQLISFSELYVNLMQSLDVLRKIHEKQFISELPLLEMSNSTLEVHGPSKRTENDNETQIGCREVTSCLPSKNSSLAQNLFNGGRDNIHVIHVKEVIGANLDVRTSEKEPDASLGQYNLSHMTGARDQQNACASKVADVQENNNPGKINMGQITIRKLPKSSTNQRGLEKDLQHQCTSPVVSNSVQPPTVTCSSSRKSNFGQISKGPITISSVCSLAKQTYCPPEADLPESSQIVPGNNATEQDLSGLDEPNLTMRRSMFPRSHGRTFKPVNKEYEQTIVDKTAGESRAPEIVPSITSVLHHSVQQNTTRTLLQDLLNHPPININKSAISREDQIYESFTSKTSWPSILKKGTRKLPQRRKTVHALTPECAVNLKRKFVPLKSGQSSIPIMKESAQPRRLTRSNSHSTVIVIRDDTPPRDEPPRKLTKMSAIKPCRKQPARRMTISSSSQTTQVNNLPDDKQTLPTRSSNIIAFNPMVCSDRCETLLATEIALKGSLLIDFDQSDHISIERATERPEKEKQTKSAKKNRQKFSSL